MALVPCTLFELRYHLGVGALCNSLVRSGYRGMILAGYKGELPPWCRTSTPDSEVTDYFVTNDVFIRFIRLSTPSFLTHYKSRFLLDALEYHCEAVCYFDPDITLTKSWSFFEEWSQFGVGLCADVNYFRPAGHPYWGMLDKLLNGRVRGIIDPKAYYFNAGFICLDGKWKEFLHEWERIGIEFERKGYYDRKLNQIHRRVSFPESGREVELRLSDQDLMNLVCGLTECPLSPYGPDGMGFAPGGSIMHHAIGSQKPWNKFFIGDLFKSGNGPSSADCSYWSNCSDPIKVFSANRRMFSRLDIAAAKILKRIL